MNGSESEHFVTQKLIQDHWTILARNFRVKGSELDIVAQKNNLIVAVEVKFRRHLHFCSSQQFRELFNPRKISFLKHGLNIYAEQNHLTSAQKQIDGAVVTLRNRRFIIIHYLRNIS